jgi:uncharacterized membrane protein
MARIESMSALLVVQLLALFTTGLLAGIFFGDRMGNSFARPRLPPSAFVTFQQVQNHRFARMMPLPILAALVSDALWLVLLRKRMGTPSFILVAAGTLALVLCVVITRTVNIPINDRLATWNAFSPPLDMARIWARWERVHTLRTVLAVLSFALVLLAFGLDV